MVFSHGHRKVTNTQIHLNCWTCWHDRLYSSLHYLPICAPIAHSLLVLLTWALSFWVQLEDKNVAEHFQLPALVFIVPFISAFYILLVFAFYICDLVSSTFSRFNLFISCFFSRWNLRILTLFFYSSMNISYYIPWTHCLSYIPQVFVHVFSFPLNSKYSLCSCDLFLLSVCCLEGCRFVPKYLEVFQIAAIDF